MEYLLVSFSFGYFYFSNFHWLGWYVQEKLQHKNSSFSSETKHYICRRHRRYCPRSKFFHVEQFYSTFKCVIWLVILFFWNQISVIRKKNCLIENEIIIFFVGDDNSLVGNEGRWWDIKWFILGSLERESVFSYN